MSRLRHWDDHDSWREFFNTYGQLVYAVAIKSGLTPSEAEDVVQETVIYVAKKMPDFRYNPAGGSFKGWLLQLTRWRIIDQLRNRKQFLEPAGCLREEAAPLAAADPPAYEPFTLELWNEEWKNNMLQAAMDRIKRQVSPKTFQIFDLYVLQGWPVKKVRELLGVSIGRIYLTKHRVSNMIKREMQMLEEHSP